MTATQQNYLTISRRSLDVEDYVDLARRHIAWIAGPIFAGLVISIVIAFVLPNKYESTARMQITPRQVSEALVPATVSQRLAERIQQMQNNILSRASLSSVIQNQGLYKEELANGTLEDVIEAMRKKDLHLSTTSLLGSNGKQASAFDITFQYRNRLKAKATVDALIARFQEENTNAQHNQETTLKAMFGDAVTEARANLQKANDNLTNFRMQNQGRLPEQTNANIAAMTSLQTQVMGTNEQLNRLATSRMQIESALNSIRSQMAAARLILTQSQEYSPINSASPAARQNDVLDQLNKAIASSELSLEQYLQSFKEGYPEVKDLRKRLEVLKARRDQLIGQQEKDQAEAAAAAMSGGTAQDAAPKKPNPQMSAMLADYQQKIDAANAALKSNDIEHDFRLKEQERLNREIAAYRDRLAPSGVEAQIQGLMNEQANAMQEYQDALKKQQMTAQSGEVVQRGAGELLEVIDPPSLPVNPTKPNRLLIVAAGVMLSVLVGLALAGVQEARDTSLKNLKDVRAYTNLPVLGSIPLLENTFLVKRKRRIAFLSWSAAVIVGVIAVSASLFYYYSVTLNS